MYIQSQLESQIKVINDEWHGLSEDELLIELYTWVIAKYPLLYWNNDDLKIWTDIHPITIKDTYDCIVSNNIISQCKKIYPEAII